MARLPRVVVPGLPQHVVQRGNNRCAIFHDQHDQQFFLQCMREACDQYRCDVHAYVLMTNHVHVLLSPHTADGPSRLMQSVGARYAQYFNSRYGRIGTLWQGRYKAAVVDTEKYFLLCARYIELNPVRAGVARHPADYPWSSYGHNALGRPDSLIREHPLFELLGRTRADRCSAYERMFADCIADRTLGLIRDSTNRGLALGDEPFRRHIETRTRRQAAPRRKQPGLRVVDM